MLVQVASLLDGEIRSQIGDAPVYLSFDSDSLDPAYVCWKLERLMWVV
jgi:arginase family enzyme